MEENKKELQSLLTRLGKIVPTMVFIDLCSAIVKIMEQRQELRVVIFSAVTWFMQENPKYRDAMQKALDKLKELDEHQRTTKPK